MSTTLPPAMLTPTLHYEASESINRSANSNDVANATNGAHVNATTARP